MVKPDSELWNIVAAIVSGDTASYPRLLAASPKLATTRFRAGATRQTAEPFYLDRVQRYVVAGDTLLHIAAASYRTELVRTLIDGGADVHARNRLGQQPLHRAVRTRCAAAVQALLECGGNAEQQTRSGSTPMLLATRNTGRGGTGPLAAKVEQETIIGLLKRSLSPQSRAKK